MGQILGDMERVLSTETQSSKLDRMLADTTAKLAMLHPAYDLVAAQIELDCICKATPFKFSDACNHLAAHPNPVLTEKFMTDLAANQEYIDIMVAGACTPQYSYSGLLLMKSDMLLRRNGELVERPEYSYMRVAIALHGQDALRVMATFEHLLHGYYIHSPATMVQAGTTCGSLTSSHLIHLNSTTSTISAFNALHQTAAIGAAGGAVSVNFSSVPSIGADIGGIPSLGIPPLLDLYNAAAAANVSDLTGTNTEVAAYVQAWHGDIFTVLETIQAQALSKRLRYGLIVPDIFMQRAKQNVKWSLFSPSDVPLLENRYGAAFDAAYLAAEADIRIPRSTIAARSLLMRSNQQNMGMITHGDVFGATTQCSTPSETATTSEASLILPVFIQYGKVDYTELAEITKALTVNLNRVIDSSKAPSIEASVGSRHQRAISIGIQGLGEALLKLQIPYKSPEARDIAKQIMMTIYNSSVRASVYFARDHGAYGHFGGSPLSRGEYMFNLCGQPQDNRLHNWETLRTEIATYGTANSVFTSLMPMDAMLNVASLDSTIGPINSVIQKHGVFSGSYNMINPILVEWLTAIDVWTEDIRVQIMRGKGRLDFPYSVYTALTDHDLGSIAYIKQIPRQTSWELGPEAVIDMAITAAPYVCQGQSLDLHLQNPCMDRIMDMHYRSWAGGLKTGIFTLKTRSESAAYVMPSPARSRNPIDSQKAICSIVLPRLIITHDASTSSAPAIVSHVATLQSLETNVNADDNNSESDDSDIYGPDNSEDADADYDEDADDEAANETTSEEIDELMYDPMEFIEAGEY
ncbi:hypothetical protein D9619_012395 [Psilocybe cf. subviscida]|uniref:Ribonucleoside-diphosphate reductase n=1 Tax=Psilocybe cf. subviscida TaxID=2480587 RepID=A0A8H5ER74_9AGAR|nr:hypothetical protein D9619_012395 [Psilocybe cf. subviscida]